jgi:hypothetical protein
MELSNSLVSVPLVPDKPKNSTQENSVQKANTSDRSLDARPQAPRRIAAPEDLERKSNEIQQNRVQRIDTLDSAPLRTQQALSIYQQTEEAGRAYVEGELVGLDMFV